MMHAYPKNSGPTKNPHKGWNSGWYDTFEEATVGFQYLSWANFEPKDNEFDFAKVESIINQKGSAGKHFVLRLYCDWAPNDVNSNCPSWMYSQAGVKRIQGAGGTYITDYNDPNYVNQAVEAIQALARRYDGDPRVHAFQIGVLGYWGEWHTAGFSRVGGGGYSISDATANTIVNAYKTSFTKSKLQGRYPWREPLKSTGGIGFHNDYFVPNNGHSDEFDASVSAGGQWLNGPVGGETPPRSDSERLAELRAMHTTPKGASMITTGHYSTMAAGYRVPPGDPYYASSMNLHRMMGYNFQIQSAKFADTLSTGSAMPVELMVSNIGVAPIYYDWTVQFALLNSSDEAVTMSPANFRLTTAKPGDTFALSANLPPTGVTQGSYRLAVRVIQPGADAPKSAPWKLDARNTYILFANDLPVLDGSWSTNQALKGGWSVLGPVTVR